MVVFVYGTLMRGTANHDVLARTGARFVGDARTTTTRTLVDLGPYPALLPFDRARDAGATPVTGELFEIEAAALETLDAFEGTPSLFRRETIAVVLDGAVIGVRERSDRESVIDAYVYVLAREMPAGARVIGGGRYRP
jgi:gamma-glutamylcyclotransferase (GGCT)/AIG2-like uncharacterized protein YtfP